VGSYADRVAVSRLRDYVNGESQPLVSIVTPCLNAARFLEQAIESVLSQDYPRVEYIVMDAGSRDGSLEILNKYSRHLDFHSAADDGPAGAINRGFAKSSGQILAWLNADDAYLPGAIKTVVERWQAAAEAAVVYGEARWIDEEGRDLGRYPTMAPYDRTMFREECGICQPACFMRREAFESVGGLNARLQVAFDYDLWIRLSEVRQFLAIPETIAVSRMHRANKSLGNRLQVFQENISLLRRHYEYVPVNWIYGYLSFRRDGRDQFFEPLRRSPAVFLYSLAAGSFYNYRHMWRFWKEWGSRLRSGVQHYRAAQ
jgi:glycosyltransferase involved in cell wall biosynthesis